MATISFHNGGGLARRSHNIRSPKTVQSQHHIDPNGIHEIWYDENPRKAYDRIFGDALREYNINQTRPERRIRSYYNHIEKDAKKHTVYEVIVSVGSVRDPVDPAVSRQILREFYDGWKQRNPHLEVCGCYLHADEATVHIHLDYIPYATGYTKGMGKQNGLVKALGQMGFEKKGKETAQILWEKREREVLESICKEHGITVEHPLAEEREHIRTEDYKMRQELLRLQSEKETAVKENERIIYELNSAHREKAAAVNEAQQAKKEAETARRETAYIRKELERLKASYGIIAKKYNQLVEAFNALAVKAKELGITVDQKVKGFVKEITK